MKDEILEVSTKHPIFALITVFLLLTFLLVVVAWFLSEFKAKRFKQNCIYLRSLIMSLDVNFENYLLIKKEYNELDCVSDSDCREKRKIFMDWQAKFKDVSPYKVTDEFSPQQLDVDRLSHDLKIANELRF